MGHLRKSCQDQWDLGGGVSGLNSLISNPRELRPYQFSTCGNSSPRRLQKSISEKYQKADILAWERLIWGKNRIS